jgi:hypothetical protein
MERHNSLELIKDIHSTARSGQAHLRQQFLSEMIN